MKGKNNDGSGRLNLTKLKTDLKKEMHGSCFQLVAGRTWQIAARCVQGLLYSVWA